MKTGDISRIEGNAIVIGKDSLFINSADVTGFKVGNTVEYEVEGPNLKSIRMKSRPPHIMLKGSGYVIIAGTTEGEKKYTLVENALKYIGSFKEGDLVNFSMAGKDQIKKMWKVDENGEYKNKDKEGNQRNGQPATPTKTLTIGGTINLENYENLKIEISGPFNSMEDAKALQKEFREVAMLFQGDVVTKGLVKRYMDRVVGPGGQ